MMSPTRMVDSGLYLIKSDPWFKNLKGDPRYEAFLTAASLPETGRSRRSAEG